MIQALVDRTLLPAAESLDYLTTIGLEALSQPDLEVFICSEKDPALLSELKQVINTMLHVSPDNRTSSAEALPKMESLLKVCAESPLLKSMHTKARQSVMLPLEKQKFISRVMWLDIQEQYNSL